MIDTRPAMSIKVPKARPSDAELRKLKASADPKVAGLASQVRRLRRLLVEVYPHVNETRGSEVTQAALEKRIGDQISI